LSQKTQPEEGKNQHENGNTLKADSKLKNPVSASCLAVTSLHRRHCTDEIGEASFMSLKTDNAGSNHHWWCGTNHVNISLAELQHSNCSRRSIISHMMRQLSPVATHHHDLYHAYAAPTNNKWHKLLCDL